MLNEGKNDELTQRFIKLQCSMRKFHPACLHKELNKSEHITMATQFILATDGDMTKSPVGIGISMKALAASLEVTPAMVTKTITALEKKGFEKRINDLNDRRSVKVCVTEKGFDVWVKEHKHTNQIVKKVFEKMGAEKAEQFFSLNEEFVDILFEELAKEENK